MRFRVPSDHPCLPGHFPGNPVVPGVVILDEVVALVADRLGHAPAALQLAQVKFVQPLLPEQEATIELQGEAPQWRFAVRHGERVLASGSVRVQAQA
ncbi:MAG: hypothetical protein ABN502_08390 [Gammaproteobacteria bacterium]|jgi:3-hydroxymyristoyl/3-hydroxydecanoyl-(acyl carrier protein) dehydratase|uniref:ApeI dehydratase-like domain-containing protein n=1 Tax=Xanthomonas boreopolis TaxID=86183 RepID=A0A919F8H2_9XANT|nr:hypothetical protein GCM10009090_19180 [[Pseudomonas] boreopolis]